MDIPSDLQPDSSRFHAFVVVEEWHSSRVGSRPGEPYVTGNFTFEVAPWAIVWSSQGGRMAVTVNDSGTSGRSYSQEVLNTSQEGQGISYVNRVGTFCLTIEAQGQWVVKVVEVD